jgi:DNA repair exonuclease SbcCD nuclease subunit
VSALIFTDPHFHAHPAFARHLPDKGYSTRVEEGLRTLDWLVETAHEREVDTVICLGDVFHVPGFLDPIVAYEVSARFQKFMINGRKLVIIGGNHDVAGSQHSSIGVLPGITVWRENLSVHIQDIGHVWCCPWTHNLNPKAGYKGCVESPKYMFGHFICHDVEVATGHRIHGLETVDRAFIEQFDQVLLGDAHTHQVIGNTTYLGSVLKNSFNDDGERGYAFIMEPGGPKGFTLEKVTNPFSPVFLRLSTAIRPVGELLDWIDAAVLETDPHGTSVYLDIQASPKDAAKIEKRFRKTTLRMRTRPLVEQKETEEVRLQTRGSEGPTDVIRQYVAHNLGESEAAADALVKKGEEYLK